MSRRLRSFVEVHVLKAPRKDLASAIERHLKGADTGRTYIFLESIEDHAPKPPSGAKIYCLMPVPHDRKDKPPITIPALEPTPESTTLILYAPIDCLGHWTSFSEDINRLLVGRRQLMIILMMPFYRLARVEDFRWVLSVLLGMFSPQIHDVTLEFFPARIQRNRLLDIITMLSPRFWLRLPRRALSPVVRALKWALSYQLTSGAKGDPEKFSALIIRAAARVGPEPASSRAMPQPVLDRSE